MVEDSAPVNIDTGSLRYITVMLSSWANLEVDPEAMVGTEGEGEMVIGVNMSEYTSSVLVCLWTSYYFLGQLQGTSTSI